MTSVNSSVVPEWRFDQWKHSVQNFVTIEQMVFERCAHVHDEQRHQSVIERFVHQLQLPREGFVFFTARDTENAVEYGEMEMSFGAFDGDAEKSGQIARKVMEALKETGLEAQWSGEASDRIQLPEIEWKKRRVDLDA